MPLACWHIVINNVNLSLLGRIVFTPTQSHHDQTTITKKKYENGKKIYQRSVRIGNKISFQSLYL